MSGGRPDETRGAALVLDEFRGGKAGRLTLERAPKIEKPAPQSPVPAAEGGLLSFGSKAVQRDKPIRTSEAGDGSLHTDGEAVLPEQSADTAEEAHGEGEPFGEAPENDGD
jgi:hypothetical protein